MIDRLFVPVIESVFRADWETIHTNLDAVCLEIESVPSVAPPLVAQCLLVSGEDHRHRHHPGFDFIAIGRAIWRRISRGTREGGSTIEQQIVRVLTGRYERTIMRKLREIALATLVVKRYEKYRLPAAYLWIGYYGWRMNGYLNACRQLGLSPHALSTQDAARVVARLKYPQPKTMSAKRMSQIEQRAKHLCVLYRKHMIDGSYKHLNDQTVHEHSSHHQPVPQP